MKPKQCLDLVRELVEARQTVTTIRALSARCDNFSLADAYVVASFVDAEWTNADHHRNGVKIGLTNEHKWAALGVSAPMWGRTYTDTTVDDCTSPVYIHALVSPRVEAEVIVGLARTLEPGASATEVALAIDWVALGFELVDSHVADWNVKPSDLVADFGAHAGLVIGPRRRLGPTELVGLAQLTVELSNGTASSIAGRGDALLGGPVPAMVAHLAAPDAPILEAGSIVSTGTLTGMAHPIVAGEQWLLEPTSGPLPGVELNLSAAGNE
jgi:2-keto-4-pentenoate hydratase